MNKKQIRLTESDLHRIVKESVSKILTESTQFDSKLTDVINFLEVLAERLDDGLIGVQGFEGGNKMFAVSSIRECVSSLKKMSGNLYAV